MCPSLGRIVCLSVGLFGLAVCVSVCLLVCPHGSSSLCADGSTEMTRGQDAASVAKSPVGRVDVRFGGVLAVRPFALRTFALGRDAETNGPTCG